MSFTDKVLLVNAIAILVAPLVALLIADRIQRWSDTRKAKLDLFSTLISSRHDSFSMEGFAALNSIDAVYAKDRRVREAWTRFYTAMNDTNLNVPVGWSYREEKRRELMLEMVRALGLSKKISSADLLRGYTPTVVAEINTLAVWERQVKRAELEEELNRRGIQYPPWPTPSPPPTPVISAPPPNPLGENTAAGVPATTLGGNGPRPPRS
jgi:hypothetical protein